MLWLNNYFQGLIPVSYVLKRLGDKSLVMRHHGLGPNGVRPLAYALMVSFLTERPSWSRGSFIEPRFSGLGPGQCLVIHRMLVHCLLREIYPTNHHSSQENVIYGTSCLLLAFSNPKTFPLSIIRSIHLMLSPSPLSLSLSSYFHCWGFV